MRTAKIVIVGGVTLAAGLVWLRVFQWTDIGLKLIFCALLPVALYLLLTLRRHRGLPLTSLVSSLALVWFLAVFALHDTVAGIIPTPAALTDTARGLIDGWSQIVSVPLPVPPTPLTLVLPLATVWLAALVGVEIVDRTQFPLGAVVAPFGTLLLALVLGVGGPGSYFALPTLFLAGSLLLASLTARPLVQAQGEISNAHRPRRVAEAGFVGLAALVVAPLLGPQLPFVTAAPPYNPRASTVVPTQPVSVVNPLVLISEWARESPRNLMTVRTSRRTTLNLAVLSSYNPVEGWTDSSSFERIATTIPGSGRAQAGGWVSTSTPATATSSGSSASISQHIRLGDLPGPWLPAANRATAITGISSVLADGSTGIVVAADGSAAHATYTVRSLVPANTSATCTGLDAVPYAGPGIPVAIGQAARNLMGPNAPPCNEAMRLLGALTTGGTFKYNTKAPSGSNVQVLEHFLSGTGGGAKEGTSEQFASAFALMADSLGMSSRVVVGFQMGRPSSRGKWTITTKDAFAYDQIDFAGAGWLSFDPTPIAKGAPPPPIPQPSPVPTTVPHSCGASCFGPVPPNRLHSAKSAGLPTGLWIALIVLGALVALVLMVTLLVWLVRRRRRRRRRNSGDTRARVIGAWLESADSLADVGVTSNPSDTADDLALAGVQRLGRSSLESLDGLASMVNQAMYAAMSPPEAIADEAWARADDVEAATRANMSRSERIGRLVDVRVLTPKR